MENDHLMRLGVYDQAGLAPIANANPNLIGANLIGANGRNRR